MKRKVLVALVALALVLSSFMPSAFAAVYKATPVNHPFILNEKTLNQRLARISNVVKRIDENSINIVGSSQRCSNRGVILIAQEGTDLNKAISQLKKVAPSFRVIYQYKYVFKGIGGIVDVKDYAKLEGMSSEYGLSFFPARTYTIGGWPSSDWPNMAFSTELIDANQVNKDGYTGKGTVVAILDTGIRPDHEFFYRDGTEPVKNTPWKALIGSDKKFVGGYDFFGTDYCNPQPDDDPTVGPGYDDPAGHPHGTHVAGTVAGVEGTFVKGNMKLKLSGVAPDAQLYIAKVFPGKSPFYASDFAIIGAVDKLIELKKKGVNIVAANMSLGATYGFDNPNDPEQKAIEAAIKEGISFAISAGNEGHFLEGSYPKATDTIYPLNINTLGSPGSTPDAITVAASNNAAYVVQGFKLNKKINAGYGETDMVPYLTSSDSDDPKDVITGTVALAIADPTNLTACNADDVVDLTGKVALIKRGGCYFSTKVLNAYQKGAIGVIVWNHEKGGDTFVNMYLGQKAPIPAVFIWNSYGKVLHEILSKGENIQIRFVGTMVVPMNTDELGAFSSWGALPSLLLKPDVSAPGVNITSAVINDPHSYDTWNGTSMAAPHVAGAIALLKQAYPDATPAEVKMALMNHADILFSKDKPWQASPRKQGAGRINIAKAIKYKGLTMESAGFPNEEFNGKPSISLGVIDKLPLSFKVKVSNNTATTVDAKVGVFAFSGATPGFGIFSATVTADKSNISLTPGSSDLITVTIQDVDLIGWVEGFIMLYNSENDVIASIPFAGIYNPGGPYYYGNGWKGGAMPAVDWPWWSPNRYLDYWGTRYGKRYADKKGLTALLNMRIYTTKSQNGTPLFVEYITQPVGIPYNLMESYIWSDYDWPAFYSAGYASYCSRNELEFAYDLASHELPYSDTLAGTNLTKQSYNLGKYILEENNVLALNLSVMRGSIKYEVELVDENGDVVSKYSTGDLWSGVIRKGWERTYYYNSLNDYYEYAFASIDHNVKEGKYTVRLKVWPRPVINPFNKEYDYEPQVIEMPLIVDKKAPEYAVTVDIQGNKIRVFTGGKEDVMDLAGYKLYVFFKNMPSDAAYPYVLYYVPAYALPYTIDISNVKYYDSNFNVKVAHFTGNDISKIYISAEDGAHNINTYAISLAGGLSKQFYVGGGYSLVYADQNYKISPKAYFGADEIYRLEGGAIKEVKGKPYNKYVPNLVDASSDEVTLGHIAYLIRRDNPGYAYTILSNGYDFQDDTPIATVDRMIVLAFDKDTPISAISADANIVKVYDLYTAGKEIKTYGVKVDDSFVFKGGHKYLIIFDAETTVSIGK